MDWTCKHDSENDEYKYELEEKVNREEKEEGEGEEDYDDRNIFNFDRLKLSIEEEAIRAKSPTMDRAVQTSRKPSLDLYECKYGYHFPTSPTPSMLSQLAKQVSKGPSAATLKGKAKTYGYGKNKLTMPSDEEEQLKRLKEMFPTATEPFIEQMIKNYQGREGCIKAALISFGYKRATDYGAQQATAQSPIMIMMAKPTSKKLFDKLVSYFPDKDEQLIKELMYQHKEVEHEIISILVESTTGSMSTTTRHPDDESRVHRKRHEMNGSLMKLRYLKFLFPTCEEIELYHLLHCNYLNVQKVIEQVERKGHKRANIDEVMQNRKTQTQQMRAQQAAFAARDKAPVANPLELHKNRTKPTVTESRANNLKESIKKSLGENNTYSDSLILNALDAADYNEGLAKKFLQETGTIDEALYKKRYTIERESKPDSVFYACKGIQKGDSNFMSVTVNEHVAIPREYVESKNALALLKVDACTSTQDLLIEEIISPALGSKKDELVRGSIFKTLETKASLRKGPQSWGLRIGSQYEKLCKDEYGQKYRANIKGRTLFLAKGRDPGLSLGPNKSLTQRIHPFFKELKVSSNQFAIKS